mgnify:CR=1 FL=1
MGNPYGRDSFCYEWKWQALLWVLFDFKTEGLMDSSPGAPFPAAMSVGQEEISQAMTAR